MPALPRNLSTTVRFALLRTFFRVSARLFPRWAEARAFVLYGQTARKRVTPVPQAPGLTAAHFQVSLPTGRLAGWQWGGDEDPTILLVHGWGGHAAQMKGFVAPLVAAGFRVVAFDQPAHGTSQGDRTNLLEFRQAVLAVAEKVGPVTGVIAHSLGATASVLALARNLGAGHAVLIAPPLDPGEFVDAFATAIALPASLASRLKERVRAFLRADLGAVAPSDLARQMTAAALVIHDTDDRAVPSHHGRTLADAWPGATFLPVSGLGHNKILRDPTVIARACAFVAQPSAVVRAGAGRRELSSE